MTDASKHSDELRAFFMVVRQALLMIVAYIERTYGLGSHKKQVVADRR
jgi:hypothetical protein